MDVDTEKRRVALSAFAEKGGFKVGRWEKESGVGDGTLRKFLDRIANTITDRTLQRLAAGATKILERPATRAVTVSEMLAEADIVHFSGHGHVVPQIPSRPIEGVAETPGRPDIPVWASVAAGDGDGEMILIDSPIDYVRRSEKMLGVNNPFAFYIVGDSMENRFYAGDQVVINPAQPLKTGDDCVFIHTAGDGVMYGLVKRLLRNLADHYKVRQFNPVKDFELSKKKWSKAYRIAETRHRG